MLSREAQTILEAARRAWERGQGVALATVVKVVGSAYRREGAKMLAHEDGTATCMISGGCLEPEVVEVAKEAMRQGRAVRVRYDLDEDTVWGLGLGCGGAVEVLIQPLQEGSLLHRFLELQARGEEAVLATPLAGGEGYLLLRPGGSREGSVRPPEMEEAALELGRALLGDRAPRARTVPAGEGEVFLDVSAPPPRLVVFGAGHDAIPLVAMARDLGFRVTVVDPRPAYATQERFPGAEIVLARPHEFPQKVCLDRHSYVVIMNHHVDRDREALAFALGSPAPYVGLLGPRSRFQRLAERLALEPADLERIYSPVGLDIGAEAPEEVAVSVLAEVMAVQRGHGGRHLREREGPVHARPVA